MLTKHKYELAAKRRGRSDWPLEIRGVRADLLDSLARRPEHQHFGAAASLREGLEETLALMRLGLPENLERVLSSTNLIENLFSRVREIGRRVGHWQSGTIVLCWIAAGLLEAERGFGKLIGYRAMPALVAALRAHDTNGSRPRG